VEKIELVVKIVAGALIAIWAGLIPLVQLLLILILIDIVSGVVVAIQERRLSSDVAWKGMTRKAMSLLMVAMAGVIQHYAADLVGNLPLQTAVAGFYCAGEVLSILENATNAGLPVPEILRQTLAKISPEKG